MAKSPAALSGLKTVRKNRSQQSEAVPFDDSGHPARSVIRPLLFTLLMLILLTGIVIVI